MHSPRFLFVNVNVRVCNLHSPHRTGHIENWKQNTANLQVINQKMPTKKNRFTGSSSCEMIILWIKSRGENTKVCMRIFRTALRSKKRVEFSIKIPHLTSTVHRLLSDRRLLCWKVATLASYSFLDLLLLREGVNQEMDNSLKRPRRSKGSGHKTSNTSW